MIPWYQVLLCMVAWLMILEEVQLQKYERKTMTRRVQWMFIYRHQVVPLVPWDQVPYQLVLLVVVPGTWYQYLVPCRPGHTNVRVCLVPLPTGIPIRYLVPGTVTETRRLFLQAQSILVYGTWYVQGWCGTAAGLQNNRYIIMHPGRGDLELGAKFRLPTVIVTKPRVPVP